eukprot:m.8139 g.8139  ORF g.8139 m.8139 type:complete len:337 (+) comp2256_c0_seq2:149-1159(+)
MNGIAQGHIRPCPVLFTLARARTSCWGTHVQGHILYIQCREARACMTSSRRSITCLLTLLLSMMFLSAMQPISRDVMLPRPLMSGTHVFKDVDEYLQSMALDSTHPFKSVLNLSRRNPYISVPCGTKLLEVARILSSADPIVHRIAVEKDGKIVKLISQSHIVDILAANIKVFAHVLEGSLAAASFLKPVASIPATSPILEALELICQNRISGVAVVDPDSGALVGNLSGSDIRALLATEEVHYDFFKLTAIQVVQVSRQMLPKHPSPGDAKAFAAVVVVHPETPVVEAIVKLAATKLHRMYITDTSGKPVGVLTLGDVLRHWVRTPKTVAIPAAN